MIKQVKSDIKRYLYSKASVVVLLFSLFFVVWHVATNIVKEVYVPELYYCPTSVYDIWMGSSVSSIQSFAYFLILPLICLLASGTCYFEDNKNGYKGLISVRLGRKKYLLSRYLSMFIYGGMAFIIPLILDMVIMFAFFPGNLPEPIVGIGPSEMNLFGELYYSAPLLYSVWMLLINFLFAGGMSGVALFFSMFSSYKYEPILIPFAIYFGIYCVSNLVDLGDFSPNYFLLSDGINHNGIEFLISFMIFGIFFVLYMKKGLNYEV